MLTTRLSFAAMNGHLIFAPIFLFFLISCIAIATSTPHPYKAVEDITVNCGTTGKLKAMDQREWVGDIDSTFTPIEEPTPKPTISNAQTQGSGDPVPYMTAHISYLQFTYLFRVTPGPKFVRLYFYSAVYSGFESSKDFFSVKAGSFTLLRNFSSASSEKKNFFKEFCIKIEKNQKLNLTFIPFSSKYYAFINGIEIVSMPLDLYYWPDGLVKAEKFIPDYVGENPQFHINYSMALEMIHRLNVGGASLESIDDTGMYREWSEDRDYLTKVGAIPRDPSLVLKYTEIPNYTAPDAVYQSAMSMGLNRTDNLLSNLTWELPVDAGFNYLVRLHFCEIVDRVDSVGERQFIIYIDYQLAEETADVILWTRSNLTPYYKDYVVMIRNKGNDNHTLSIDLHPTPEGTSLNVILNGVEVFKMSNPDGNLARHMVPPQLDQEPPTAAKEYKTKKTTFIAIGSGVGLLVVLTLVCCVVLCKLKKTKRYDSYCPLAKWWCWSRPDLYKREFSRRAASSLPGELCRYFRLDEIKTATNNFNEDLIIGVGGFGNVYKGLIEQGNV